MDNNVLSVKYYFDIVPSEEIIIKVLKENLRNEGLSENDYDITYEIAGDKIANMIPDGYICCIHGKYIKKETK